MAVTGERPRREAERPRGASDLGARVLIAIPAAAYAIFIVVQGGAVFALGIYVLGVVALASCTRSWAACVRPPWPVS